MLGLHDILPPTGQEKHAPDNRTLLCCFALQLMLQQTLTQPLPQTQEFHRSPDYNADLPNQIQHIHLQSESGLHKKLVQCVMKWLQRWHSNTSTQLMLLFDSLHQSGSASKLPLVDDVAFLDVSQLEVCPRVLPCPATIRTISNLLPPQLFCSHKCKQPLRMKSDWISSRHMAYNLLTALHIPLQLQLCAIPAGSRGFANCAAGSSCT